MKDLGKVFVDVTRYHRYLIHNAVSKVGLGRGMPPVLEYLIHNDGCKQSDISREGHVTPATATVMLQTLERNGLITRRGDERDQRCMRLYITDEGRSTAEKGKEAIDRSDEEFFSALTDEEQATLYALLIKLRGSIENYMKKNKTIGKEKQV